MTLGQKLKEIRRKFGLPQEQLAEIMNVSRQAITKWESDNGLPDVSNLQELSKVFGITVDYLLNNDNSLPALSMKKQLDKDKYKMNPTGFEQIINEYYGEPWEVYYLTRRGKSSKLAWIFGAYILRMGPVVRPIDGLNDLTPYYLAKKDNLKLLINIKDYVLEVIELPERTNERKFIYGKNIFRKSVKVKR